MKKRKVNKQRLVNDIVDLLNGGEPFINVETRNDIQKAIIGMIPELSHIKVDLNLESEVDIRVDSMGRAKPCKPFTYRSSVLTLYSHEPEIEIEIRISSAKPNPVSKILKTRERKIKGKRNAKL